MSTVRKKLLYPESGCPLDHAPSHEALNLVVTANILVNDTKKFGDLSFVKNPLLAGKHFLRTRKMEAGMKLAALDHNHNVNRAQVYPS